MTSQDVDADVPDHLLARVSNLPIVNQAIRVYDYSKANSRVINVCTALNFMAGWKLIISSFPQYGAGLVESSVKTISRPVIDRLPVEQLDDFACRQLDRVGGGFPSIIAAIDLCNTRSWANMVEDRHPAEVVGIAPLMTNILGERR